MRLTTHRTVVSFLVAATTLMLGSEILFAGGSTVTWESMPGSGDWNTAANWTPAIIPNGSADVAHFGLTNTTGVSISADTEVDRIVFDAMASAFTITATPTFTLTLSGTGIINNSGIVQNFLTTVDAGSGAQGVILFTNSATADTNTTFTNNGGTMDMFTGGRTTFFDTSNAGSATFTNNPGTISGARGGFTEFFGMSNANNATFNNNGGALGGAGGGFTLFGDGANAATAVFNNNGGAANDALGGYTQFGDNSSAANGTFNNSGAAFSGATGGLVKFLNTSTAANATFNNNGSTALTLGSNGSTQFYDTSTADHGIFNSLGSGAVSAPSGTTEFFNGSTGANGTFNNLGGAFSGGVGGLTEFNDMSTAANGTYANEGGTGGGVGGGTIFRNSATAANGDFTNNGAASGSFSGFTRFEDGSTAGSGTFTSNGGVGAGSNGGFIEFFVTSTAANGMFTTNGGVGAGAGGAAIAFEDSATAGAATLITNGGTGGGSGGTLIFYDTSDGGTARAELFGNGSLDISPHDLPGMTIGSIEGDGFVFLGANNLTVGSNNLDTEFSGVIQDGGGIGVGVGGSLTKIGTGTLTLSNDNTYTGGTIISAGALAVGSLNALGTGDVTVNGGTLQTSNGPRAIAVGGNYMQTSGTLRLQIGGLDSGSESDFLTVTGTASLGGTLSLVRINNFNPMNGDRVNIIGGPGGHSGEFANVTSDFLGILQPMVFYDDPLDVYILFQITSFVLPGLTPNQHSVAEELDNVINDPRAANLVGFLSMEPPGNLPHDYDLIAPEELASIYEIGFSHANIQTLNLQRRMDDIRAGSNGFSSAGLSMALVNAHSDTTQINPNGELLAGNPPPRYMQSAPDNRWGVFATGTGEFINVGDHDFNAPGYDITTGGFTLGVDYRVCPTFAIGLDGGYAGSTADLVDDGRVTVDGGKVGIYATWFPAELYITGAFNAGWNSYDTRRTALMGDALGSTDGYELNGFLGAGYDWKMNSWTFGPVATIQYTYIDFNSFTETGSLAPLHFPDQNEDSVRSTVGARLAYDWRQGNMIVRPEVRASWQHEYADRAYPIDSQFASGAGDIFTVWGPHIGRDAALVSGGLAVQWNERVSTYVAYDGVLGRDNYNSHNVSGGLRVSF